MTTLLCDSSVLIAVHALLGLVLIAALLGTLVARFRRGIGLEVKRGSESMSFLYVVYGIATLIYALIVQVADAAQGHKVVIITADYAVLTYLCFFNAWFRNKLIALYIRLQKD